MARSFQVLLPKNMTEQAVSVLAEYFGLTPLVELLRCDLFFCQTLSLPILIDFLSPPTPSNPQLRTHFPEILPLDVRGR